MVEDALAAFRQNLKEERKQRKSDEIISFIRNNWKLFSPSAAYMRGVCEELEQRGELTVSDLCDALDVPSCVMFKKVKAVDASSLLLNVRSSPIYKLYMEKAESADGLVLVVVAGERSLIVTDRRTEQVPGLVHVYVKGDESAGTRDINIFTVKDAQMRLPSIFRKEYDNE